MREFVKTELAPIPKGSYSQAVSIDKTLYLAGQIGTDPATGELAADFAAQLKQIFLNMAAVLQAAGSDLSKVVKLTVYLQNFDQDYLNLDGIMNAFFNEPFPARTTIGVAQLPRNAVVEVDAIATIE